MDLGFLAFGVRTKHEYCEGGSPWVAGGVPALAVGHYREES